jgi:hypothetical protein
MGRIWLTAPLVGCMLGWLAGSAQAQQLGFLEKFALADDRALALAELIPGSHDYYYYHILHYQNSGKWEQAEALLQDWAAVPNTPPLFQQMLTRQRILAYAKNPQEALEYLRLELGLALDHAPPQADRARDLPTRLDPSIYDQKALLDRVLLQDPGLASVTDQGLIELLHRELSIDSLRIVLQRLQRVDLKGVIPLIEKELRTRDSRGWGAFPLHSQLTLEQRQQLAKALPQLLENDTFVRQYLLRLLPSDDVASDNVAEQRAHLQRLEDFTNSLPPSQNSLKGLVLYQRLALDASEELFDRGRFERYLGLPRHQGYYSQDFLKASQRIPPLEFHANYAGETRLPPIGDDAALVRRYLEHFFQSDDNLNRFSRWLDRGFLESVLTETKILYGLGASNVWYAKLNPQQQKELRERIELRFAPISKRYYKPDENVQLVLDIKNVPKLIVRIYQLNAQNIYRKQGKPVSTDIDLDGLVANAERAMEYTLPADRRHREKLELPECSGRGAWVVDLLGGGMRSRALIVKGQLRSTQLLTDAGHELRIFDESGNPAPQATLEMGSRTFRPEESGAILIPYGEAETTQPILLVDGAAATVEMFTHRKESYTLEMGVLMDSQNLLSGAKGSLIVRPQLLCNGQPTSIDSLEEAQLTIVTTDQDGTQSTLTVPGLELKNDAETTHQFLVPQRLRSVQVTLTGRVLALSRNVREPLAAVQSLSVNTMAATSQVADFYLIRDDQGYRLQVRGRNGEPIARLPVTVQLGVDRVLATPSAVLASDANGQIVLGGLDGVYSVQASATGLANRQFSLRRNVAQWPARMSITAGSKIELPWVKTNALESQHASDWTFLESRGGQVVKDWNDKVQLRDGRLLIDTVPAGLYYLTNHRTGSVVEIRSVVGKDADAFVLGDSQSIEKHDFAPASVVAQEIRDGKLRIRIGGGTSATRVHLYASSFLEDEGLASRFRLSGLGQFRQLYAANPSFYIDSLKLDEEYQYILQRQYATKYPGNLLSQPSLLLNPWDTASTENARQEALSGDVPPPSAAEPMRAEQNFGQERGKLVGEGGLGKSFFEFLGNSAVFMANRRSDSEGWVELPMEGLDGYHALTALVVDDRGISSETIPLPESKIAVSDLRLAHSFPVDKHLSQIQRAQRVDANQKVDLGDTRSTRIQVYSSLSDVYRLYSTLSPSADLEKFRVLTRWPSLSDEEKERIYSELACHEMHWFVYRKDRPFFDRVVAPYLDDKYSPQMMDAYLLGRDLSEFMDLWQRNRLNTLERVLLASRIPAAQSGIRKWIDDAVDAHRIPPEFRAERFLAALAGASLDLNRAEASVTALSQLGERFYNESDARFNRNGIENEQLGRQLHEWSMSADDKAARRDVLSIEAPATDMDFNAPAADPFGMPGAESMGGMGGGMGGAMGGMGSSGMPGMAGKALGAVELKLESRRKSRGLQRLFVPLDTTREWAEMQYYRTRLQQQGLGLIPPGPIWKEFAHAMDQERFLSAEFHLSNHTLTELLAVMAVLDLPFEAQDVQLGVEEGRLVLTSPSKCIVFVESIEETQEADAGASVMVGQDLYLTAPGADVDPQKPVTGQSLVRGVGYRSSVVVTNPSSVPKTISVLTQIPQGAIPLDAGKFVTSKTLRLEPYTTQQITYSFYFPKSGEFAHYGAQASVEGKNAATGPHAQLKVLDAPESQDRNSWGYLALWGTNEQVLEFLKTNNVQQLQLGLIAFRLAEKDFYEACLSELESQGIYDATLWAYSVRHNDPPRIAQLLAHRDDWMPRLGPVFVSPLTKLDSARRYDFEHLDYRPLVNARSHMLGAERVILNNRLSGQYLRLLERIAYQTSLIDGDRMAVTYYMLLQNRIDEAIQHFEKVDGAALPTQLQYDYFDAYLDFYRGRYDRAAEIANRYAAYGVTRWRDLFAQIRLQVSQQVAMKEGREAPIADVHATDVTDPIQRMLLDARGASQANLAVHAPSIDLSIQDGRLILGHQNIDQIEVRFYLMDIELLFSRNPFVQQEGGALMAIRPNQTVTIPLALARGKHEIQLPKELDNRNVLVEVTSGALSQSEVLYANSMDVTVVDAFGRLQVTAENGGPVEKAYVKVYARHAGGQVRFFKDGYTDLRGQFDFASLSTNDLDTVERFAILVLHPDRGALIRETAPPKR